MSQDLQNLYVTNMPTDDTLDIDQEKRPDIHDILNDSFIVIL